MTFWRWLLYGLATWLLLAGLWDHAWRLILAEVAVWIIYPLITADIEEPDPVPVCAGCLKGRMVPGCPVHDPEHRKAAA